MNPKLRKVFFFVYAVFFICVTPILVLVSLGYDFNIQNFELLNTLKVDIKTLPRGGSVFFNNEEIFKTPGEVRILSDKVVDFSLQRKDYLDENFLLWSNQSNNSVVSIDNLSFLPENSEVIADLGSFNIISLLSDGYAILEKDQEYFIQEFSFNGLVGEREKVSNLSQSLITSTKWERLDSGFYFKQDQQLILFFDTQLDGWELFNFQKLNVEVSRLELYDENNLLLLDTNNTLWVYNYVNNTITFVESDVDYIDSTESPDRIWISKDNNLYFWDRGLDVDELFLGENDIYIDEIFTDIDEDQDGNFEVANVGQGIAVLNNRSIYYIPDFNFNKWYIITNDAVNVESFNRNLYWLTGDYDLWYYNFPSRDLDRVGKIELGEDLNSIEFEYFSFWNRLFIYSQDELYSVWLDHDLSNENILQYSVVKWVDGEFCQDEIIERNQICGVGNKLFRYSNFSNF